MRKSTLIHIFTNAATDASVVFSVGSACITAPASKPATIINLSRAGICFLTRLCTEFEKAGKPVKLPALLQKFVANKGAAMGVSGVICLGAAGALLPKEINLGDMATNIPLATQLLFGVSNIATGVGMSLRNGLKHVFNNLGLIGTNIGLALSAGAEPNPATNIALLFSTGASLYLLARNRPPAGAAQPDLMAGGACLASSAGAFAGNDPYLGAANLLFTLGFVTLDLQKKFGGVCEYFRPAPRTNDMA